MLLELFALPLAALLGFTAHRAGICSVKAVSEVITTRRAHMLGSFAKTVLWIMTAMTAFVWAAPEHMFPAGLAPSPASVAVAFAFGMGAAINGGCAVSTVTRLGNGDLGMLLTIAAVTAILAAIDAGRLSLPAMPWGEPLPPFALHGWALALASAALAGWGAREIVLLWRGHDRACRLIDGLLHRRWRLSLAAAVIGLTNVAIVIMAGHWAYTETLRQSVGWASARRMPPSSLAATLFFALMAGVVASAWLRGSFRLRWRPHLGWLRHIAGGALMGVGVALVPGGNDGLLLDAIPSLSPHALPAFAALLFGIAATLLSLRRFTPVPRIDCGGDVCREDEPFNASRS